LPAGHDEGEWTGDRVGPWIKSVPFPWPFSSFTVVAVDEEEDAEAGVLGVAGPPEGEEGINATV
jgi:hypothetical protein